MTYDLVKFASRCPEEIVQQVFQRLDQHPDMAETMAEVKRRRSSYSSNSTDTNKKSDTLDRNETTDDSELINSFNIQEIDQDEITN